MNVLYFAIDYRLGSQMENFETLFNFQYIEKDALIYEIVNNKEIPFRFLTGV
jgi:hypothetical protein